MAAGANQTADMSEHSTEDATTGDNATTVDIKEEAVEADTITQINHLLSNGRADEAPAFNMRLIAMVKARPYLYDHTNEGYNVTPWRNAAWQEIADSLDSTPEGVKTRWKTLRDRFKKEEKKEKVTGRISNWAYQKPLKFVQKIAPKGPQIRRDSVVTPSLSDDEEEQVSPMEAAISFIEQEIIRGNEATASTSSTEVPIKEDPEVPPPPPKRARVSLTDPLVFGRPSPRTWPVEDEEDEMFARMIAVRLSKLPPRRRDLAKIRMLSALYEITDDDQA